MRIIITSESEGYHLRVIEPVAIIFRRTIAALKQWFSYPALSWQAEGKHWLLSDVSARQVEQWLDSLTDTFTLQWDEQQIDYPLAPAPGNSKRDFFRGEIAKAEKVSRLGFHETAVADINFENREYRRYELERALKAITAARDSKGDELIN